MKNTFKKIVIAASLAGIFGSQFAQAQSSITSINVPQSQWQQGTDRIRSADGIECSRSTAPRDMWLETGVAGGAVGGQGSDYSYAPMYQNGQSGALQAAPQNNYNRAGGTVFAKLVINLDKKVADIDCNSLYQLELDRLKEELKQAQFTSSSSSPKANPPVTVR